MSHFGIDLFGRENPPPGYHTASENRRINGIGPTPSPEDDVQIIICTTGFKLFCPKGPNGTKGWRQVGPKKKFNIEFRAGSLSFEEVRTFASEKCNKHLANASVLIQEACASGSVDWKVWITSTRFSEFNKNRDYTINDEASYAHWIDTVVELGRDRTDVGLEILMENPGDALKQAQAAVEIQDHILTQQAARDAALKRQATGDPGPSEEIVPVNFNPVNILMRQIYDKHEPNKDYDPKLPAFVDPNDDNRYTPLTPKMVQDWASAMRNLVDALPALTGQTRQFERCSNSRVRPVVGQALSDRSTCRRVGQACPISSWDRSHRTSRDRSDKSIRPVGSCFGRTVPVRPPVEHGCSSTA
ncbi:hypothetical protein PCASD_24583 [Puccinia coronata f. sp. avenae]|uniref:Uncharacterized protein n=1 Tax=Puccinia coronata f. sp. avenae TaxID=200324 RepID=A0A2N5RYB5_9BASI|nr:hypothetical protein PCASD_24583 [Puccinia coronata f. sp. avenae]